MITEPIIDKRDELPKLIDTLGLKVGLEIGVCKGEYSSVLLDNSKLETLYGVDAWSNDEVLTRSSLKKCDRVPGKFDEHYEIAKSALSRFGERSKLIRMLSEEAANEFADNSLDFIYVDASHRFSGVVLDLILWYPKLRTGGIMAGHDYWLKYRDEVMAAVNGFAVEKEQLLNITTKERQYPIYPPTFWFIKRDWSKSEYFEALHRHLPRLKAAQLYLEQNKVKIVLPYEYDAESLRLVDTEAWDEVWEAECKRLGVK